MSTDREKIDAQARIHLSAKHAIGPAELEILFKQRDKLAALSQTASSAQEGVREAAQKLVGSAPCQREPRFAGAWDACGVCDSCRDARALRSALSATPSASALGEALERAADDGFITYDEARAALADTAGKKGE